MSSTDEQLFIVITRIHLLLSRELDKIFREHHLTATQFAILEVLSNKGDLCVKDIQKAILSTAGNVPLVIKNLVKLGYVSRYTDEKDKRLSYISLTKKGQAIVNTVYPLQKEILKKLLNHLPQTDKKQLIKQLLPLYKQLVN